MKNKQFLFSALVGQEKLKTAYLATIINPAIGGLLISGPKGTGKSTIVHSISPLLPTFKAVKDCPFNCAPDKLCSLCSDRKNSEVVEKSMSIVNLPLSISEDRLIGTVDIEKLLKSGEKDIQVGILGEANNNILYIDEVNLLPDHIVDDILDVAASKINTIEREGLSFTHYSSFILVGTMNPEEGDLRPQILDRFPICAMLESVNDPAQRVEIIKRNLLFENDYNTFHEKFLPLEQKTIEILKRSREILKDVSISEEYLYAISASSAELKVDGQRPDIVISKLATTIAALANTTKVSKKDILLAAELTLIHRTRDGGLLEAPKADEIYEVFSKHLEEAKESSSDIKLSDYGASIDIECGSYISIDENPQKKK